MRLCLGSPPCAWSGNSLQAGSRDNCKLISFVPLSQESLYCAACCPLSEKCSMYFSAAAFCFVFLFLLLYYGQEWKSLIIGLNPNSVLGTIPRVPRESVDKAFLPCISSSWLSDSWEQQPLLYSALQSGGRKEGQGQDSRRRWRAGQDILTCYKNLL